MQETSKCGLIGGVPRPHRFAAGRSHRLQLEKEQVNRAARRAQLVADAVQSIQKPPPPKPEPLPLPPWPVLNLKGPRTHEDGLRVAGFLKVRNEIIREGNLFRVLDLLDRTCDCGVICDDASTDGTADQLRIWAAHRPSWRLIGTPPEQQDWRNELRIKESMLQIVHSDLKPDWIFWLDGDELLEENKKHEFRTWLREHGHEADVWGFPYVQLWRSPGWERTDSGFADAQFWKLWRYKPDLAFQIDDHLHRPQFPTAYINAAVTAATVGADAGRAKRAPFEIVHLGNYGKNLVLKAVQYRDSGELAHASLDRHLYFGDNTTYSRVDPQILPKDLAIRTNTPPPAVFSPVEITTIERMGDLRDQNGLCVVVVPTYNRGYALKRTISSVVKQTYRNWVCLVLDDGSTDDTPALMHELQQSDPRIFYCRYPTNRGGVAMNEIGMALACEMGEFWMRLGSDDYWEPHKLELDVLTFRNSDASVCYGPYRDLHESGPGELRNAPVDARGALLSNGFAASWANIAVRTEALKAVHKQYGSFCDARIRNMEDWLVNTRLAAMYEFVWRGMLRSGELIIGATSIEDIGIDAYDSQNGIGLWASDVLFDGVWRIGADGASQKGDQCAVDAAITTELLKTEVRMVNPRALLKKKQMRHQIGSMNVTYIESQHSRSDSLG